MTTRSFVKIDGVTAAFPSGSYSGAVWPVIMQRLNATRNDADITDRQTRKPYD